MKIILAIFLLINSFAQTSIKSDASLVNLLKLYSKDNKSYIVNIRLAWIYLQKNKYANARYHYQTAVSLNSSSIEAWLGLAATFIANKNDKDAMKCCEKILSIDKYNYYGNTYLIDILIRGENYQKALIKIKLMLSIYPTDLVFLYKEKSVYQALEDEVGIFRVQKLIDTLAI